MLSATSNTQSMPTLYPTRAMMQTTQEQSLPNLTCWPSKYASQREPIPEIPRPCVEKLLVAIDTDMDGRVSREELHDYARNSGLAFLTPEVIDTMFDEVASHRPVVHQSQLASPLTVDELIACCIARVTSNSHIRQRKIRMGSGLAGLEDRVPALLRAVDCSPKDSQHADICAAAEAGDPEEDPCPVRDAAAQQAGLLHPPIRPRITGCAYGLDRADRVYRRSRSRLCQRRTTPRFGPRETVGREMWTSTGPRVSAC